jgi:hypothetical protein
MLPPETNQTSRRPHIPNNVAGSGGVVSVHLKSGEVLL